MGIKELRAQTGLSQSKFANLFDIPVATLQDCNVIKLKI